MNDRFSLWFYWLLILFYSAIVGICVVLLFTTDSYYFDLTLIVLFSYVMIYFSTRQCKEIVENNYLDKLVKELRESKDEGRIK